MAGLVRKIETWTSTKSQDLLNIIKAELKESDTAVKELSKNLAGDASISPLHAAADSGDLELFELVLDVKGSNADIEFRYSGNRGKIFDMKCEDSEVRYAREVTGGILEFAVKSERRNLDIIRTILARIDLEYWAIISLDGHEISTSLYFAIRSDSLDILDLLLSYSNKYYQLNYFDCLILAIMLNNGKVFTRILPKALSSIDRSFGVGKSSLLHSAVRYNRVKMLRQLLEAGADVNITDEEGFTPLVAACAIAGPNNCGEWCYDRIISELLAAKDVDLHAKVKQTGSANLKACDFLNERTCFHVRKLVDQAYSRDIYRKKLEKRKGSKTQEPTKQTSKEVEKSKRMEKEENKSCWFCSAEPEKVVLLLCKGCKVAWYCGDTCQEGDWGVHGPQCESFREKRKEERKAKKEEPAKKLPSVFYDLD